MRLNKIKAILISILWPHPSPIYKCFALGRWPIHLLGEFVIPPRGPSSSFDRSLHMDESSSLLERPAIRGIPQHRRTLLSILRVEA